MAYIETPRTEAGNATLMTNGNLENFSLENSFMSPSKQKNDQLFRNGRGISLKTPRVRAPFADRRNLPNALAHGEFTPLLQSVTKNNMMRNGKKNGAPETPAFLKGSHMSGDSPALPNGDISGIYAEGSSVMPLEAETPLPQVATSSAQSTPLAVLPKRDGEGVLVDQGNMMTLREQENVRFHSQGPPGVGLC